MGKDLNSFQYFDLERLMGFRHIPRCFFYLFVGVVPLRKTLQSLDKGDLLFLFTLEGVCCKIVNQKVDRILEGFGASRGFFEKRDGGGLYKFMEVLPGKFLEKESCQRFFLGMGFTQASSFLL